MGKAAEAERKKVVEKNPFWVQELLR